MKKLIGKTWKFGDNINTDIIIPYKFKSRTNDPYEVAKYCMYGFDPEFPNKISKGDFIVAGKNFGTGSSREQAPIAIKYCGIAGVIADSFARIFYRNSFAVGLPVIEIDNINELVESGDIIEFDLNSWSIKLRKNDTTLKGKPIEKFMADLVKSGGIVDYYLANKHFPW